MTATFRGLNIGIFDISPCGQEFLMEKLVSITATSETDLNVEIQLVQKRICEDHALREQQIWAPLPGLRGAAFARVNDYLLDLQVTELIRLNSRFANGVAEL
ncbi:hypothetical protein QAD02_007957 [Eretmocerus hayati]|uniref:Uncharacterized protein n=1 Tax=Eretmocerus hayati TaxID=131215 RepID=A0ACC2N535_9HYME|nr:hypothetical protein QAD02_007957 [Eretmocerus hayati]